MLQQALDLTDPMSGFLRKAKFVILDRDPVFTKEFKGRLRDEGVKVVTLPARSPNLNAFAERFLRSVRSECLSKVIPLSEKHLWPLCREYVRHYNSERPHQGIGNRIIDPEVSANDAGPIQCRERLGGLLRFHHPEAA